MNSYIAGGLGTGVAQASRNIQNGILRAYDIKSRRELQARAAIEAQQQDSMYEQERKLNEIRLQQMQMQLKQLTAANVKNETYSAFDAYKASNGDVKYLNQALKNPEIYKIMGRVTGVYKLDLSSNGDRELLKRTLNLPDDIIDSEDFDPTRYVKITREGASPGSTEIVDMYGLYASTGYINKMKKDEVEELAIKSKNLQTRMQELQTKQAEMQVEGAETWLKNNPDKTYNDYLLAIKQETKAVTNASLKDEYANLKVSDAKGELSDDEKTRLKVLDKLFSTDNDEKRNILKKGMEITEKYRNKLFKSEISNEDVITAKLYAEQAGLKPDSKDNREFKAQFNTLRQGKRLEKEILSLGNEEIARGIIDTGIQKLKTYLADNIKPDEKMLKSIRMKTKLGKFLAAYIKSISGTAVAEQEFARLRDLLGSDDWANIHTLKEAVTDFVGELDKDFRDTAETSLLDNPATTLDLVSRYKKFMGNIDINTQTIKAKEFVVDPRTNKPTQHYIGEVIMYQGKKYKIINAAGDLEELK